MVPELTEAEQHAFRMLFKEDRNAAETSRELAKMGYSMSPAVLRRFKATIHEKHSKEMLQEYGMENMLESFEKAKLEFNFALEKLKGLIDRFETEDKPYELMMAIREWKDFIAMGLKTMGKLNTQAMQIRAKNVQVVNVADLNLAFKNLLESWFGEMQATVENGKFIFHKPSPELLDSFYKWETEQMRKAERAKKIETGTNA